MKTLFHHPDFCARVTGRKLAAGLLDLASFYGELLATGGRSALRTSTKPSDTAYRMALHRLRKAGLVVAGGTRGETPRLALTPEGEAALSPLHRPETEWKQRWDGRWQLLVYDIPEKDRAYRRTIRAVLRRLRAGCLQDSVWITPRDIRAEFHDLAEAARLGGFAFLFEARTVLGLSTSAIVERAWDFVRLRGAQQWYLRTMEEAIGEAEGGADPAMRAHEEMNAYLAVMQLDPLLPKALWPDGYAGREVVAAHRRYMKAAARLA